MFSRDKMALLSTKLSTETNFANWIILLEGPLPSRVGKIMNPVFLHRVPWRSNGSFGSVFPWCLRVTESPSAISPNISLSSKSPLGVSPCVGGGGSSECLDSTVSVALGSFVSAFKVFTPLRFLCMCWHRFVLLHFLSWFLSGILWNFYSGNWHILSVPATSQPFPL